ncbi:MAG: PKD domain-containing protein, partial [Thermoplasmatota archaeon]
MDSEDIEPYGNGVVILSIDLFITEETTFSDYDPYFKIAIDWDGDGELYEWEAFDSEKFYYPDQNLISGEGFGEGPLWHGVDVEDDVSEVAFGVLAYDKDVDANDLMDITSDPETMGYFDIYQVFDQNGSVQSQEFWDDGEVDIDIGEDDAYIELHLEVIKGTTLETASPTPISFDSEEPNIEMNEGDSLEFEVMNVFVPDCIVAPIGYEWYIAYFGSSFDEEPSDIYCVQKYFEEGYEGDDYVDISDPEKFELFANFGSEGLYGLYCVVFSDLYDDFSLYWSDIKAWGIKIDHFNTVPEAVIDITPEESIHQMDRVSISAWRSFDRDGDQLTYKWEVDGERMGEKMEFDHVFMDAGPHQIRLEVIDDETASSVVYKDINVKNLDISKSDKDMGFVNLDKNITFETSFIQDCSMRRSASVNFELIWGYSVQASASFVSEAKVHYNETLEYDFNEIDEELVADIIGSESSFRIDYRPYFEFLLKVYDDEDEWVIFEETLPVPVLSNADGLDEDGDPLIGIGTLLGQDIDIYTWDLPKTIYRDSSPRRD